VRDLYLALEPLALDAFLQQRLDVGGHVVEGRGQFAELVVRADAHAVREVAALDVLDGAVESVNCASHGARHPGRGRQGQEFEDEEDDGDVLKRLPPHLARLAAAPELLARERPGPVENETKVVARLAALPLRRGQDD
jgi:hypothetical protein